MPERVSSPTLTKKQLERSTNAAIIDGLRRRPVRPIEEMTRATLQGKTAHQAESIAHGPTTHSSEVLGAVLIAPAPVLVALGVEETTGASSMMLDEKERLNLREILRLSVGDRASEFSEEDIDDLGATLLEVTAIALKARHSQN